MSLKIELQVKELVSKLLLTSQHVFEHLHQVPVAVLAPETVLSLLPSLALVDLLLTLVNVADRLDSYLLEEVLCIFAVDLDFLVYEFIHLLIHILKLECFLIE